MNREINFRAWNKTQLWMDNVWSIDWEHDLLCFSKHNQDFMRHFVLMQSTGLKDSKGNEIYEGDILAFEDEKEFKWLVKYEYSSYIAVGGEHNQSEDLIEFYDWKKERLDVVICGNIHENPNLLEETQ